MKNKEGLEALILAGIIIFGLANAILVFESFQSNSKNDEILYRLRKLTNGKS